MPSEWSKQHKLPFSSDLCECRHARAAHWSMVTGFACRTCRCKEFKFALRAIPQQ